MSKSNLNFIRSDLDFSKVGSGFSGRSDPDFPEGWIRGNPHPDLQSWIKDVQVPTRNPMVLILDGNSEIGGRLKAISAN